MTGLTTGARVVVLGLGHYGRSVTGALRRRGYEVTVIEDEPTTATGAFAEAHGAHLVASPTPAELAAALADAHAFVPSPGVPMRHSAFDLADRLDLRILSEFDLARWWDSRPMAAVTGTDGKTSVTELTVEMLRASGISAAAVGNNDLPLIDAIDDPDLDVMVVEASSFRLAHTERFEPRVAAWLNFGPDHLDVHRDIDEYEAAKARIWATLPADALVVANLDDPVVMAHVPPGHRLATVGIGAQATARPVGDELVVGDAVVAKLSDLVRTFDHDITNTLFASTVALELGATTEGIRTAIRDHRLLPHRLQLVETIGGVGFVDDSKATVPHAVLAALRSFDSVVLIAGGRNKGLDLGVLAIESGRVRSVVAMGESAGEVADAFADHCPVDLVDGMDQAVTTAWKIARPGDVVLLSPGCASYDSYSSYAARGEDFVRVVSELKKELGR